MVLRNGVKTAATAKNCHIQKLNVKYVYFGHFSTIKGLFLNVRSDLYKQKRVMTIGIQGCMNQISQSRDLAAPRPQKKPKNNDFLDFWRRIATKRLTVQPPTAHLQNQHGMSNTF